MELASTDAHVRKLITSLAELRHDNLLTDLTLCTEDGGSESVHKVILACFSRHIGRERKQDQVLSVANLDKAQLAMMVNFIYTGILELSEDNITMATSAADQLDIPEAQVLCQKFRESTLGGAGTSKVQDCEKVAAVVSGDKLVPSDGIQEAFSQCSLANYKKSSASSNESSSRDKPPNIGIPHASGKQTVTSQSEHSQKSGDQDILDAAGYQCPVCGKRFPFYTLLARHQQRRHVLPKWSLVTRHQFSKCNTVMVRKRLKQKQNHDRMMWKMNRHQERGTILEGSSPNGRPNVCQCLHCGKVFLHQINVEKHQPCPVMNAPWRSQKVASVFVCTFCRQKFKHCRLVVCHERRCSLKRDRIAGLTQSSTMDGWDSRMKHTPGTLHIKEECVAPGGHTVCEQVSLKAAPFLPTLDVNSEDGAHKQSTPLSDMNRIEMNCDTFQVQSQGSVLGERSKDLLTTNPRYDIAMTQATTSRYMEGPLSLSCPLDVSTDLSQAPLQAVESALFDSGILGSGDPAQLLLTMVFMVNTYFMKITNLTFCRLFRSQIRCGKDSLGWYIGYFDNQGFRDGNLTEPTVKIYENASKPDRCYFKLVKKYLEVSPNIEQSFFLSPKKRDWSKYIWYYQTNIGVKTLKKMIRDIEPENLGDDFKRCLQQLCQVERDYLWQPHDQMISNQLTQSQLCNAVSSLDPNLDVVHVKQEPGDDTINLGLPIIEIKPRDDIEYDEDKEMVLEQLSQCEPDGQQTFPNVSQIATAQGYQYSLGSENRGACRSTWSTGSIQNVSHNISVSTVLSTPPNVLSAAAPAVPRLLTLPGMSQVIQGAASRTGPDKKTAVEYGSVTETAELHGFPADVTVKDELGCAVKIRLLESCDADTLKFEDWIQTIIRSVSFESMFRSLPEKTQQYTRLNDLTPDHLCALLTCASIASSKAHRSRQVAPPRMTPALMHAIQDNYNSARNTNINIFHDAEFKSIQVAIEQAVVRKSRAFSKTQTWVRLDHEGELWRRGLLGEDNPEKLQTTLLYLLTITFGLPPNNLRNIKRAQVMIDFDNRGRYLCFLKSPDSTRLHRAVHSIHGAEPVPAVVCQGLPPYKELPLKIYQNVLQPECCLVRLMDKYLKLSPCVEKTLFLQPAQPWNDMMWYWQVPLGGPRAVRNLRGLMENIELQSDKSLYKSLGATVTQIISNTHAARCNSQQIQFYNCDKCEAAMATAGSHTNLG